MCRIAFVAGIDVPLSAVLYDPPHSLSEQAWHPREQQHGNVNVDGTGVAWWQGDDPEPLRYVTTAPPWADPNLPTLAPRLTGHTVLAAVRGATPGIGFGPAFVAPFVHDRFAFVHNGWIGGFQGPVGARLVRSLPDDLLTAGFAPSDSALLFTLVLAQQRSLGDLPAAVTAALRQVAAACAAEGEPATLNVVVTDGVEAVAVRTSWGLPCNSLYVNEDRAACQVRIASEPLDHADWEPLPDHALVHFGDGALSTTTIDLEPTS